ncbi:MAG: sugar phosphate nucleotidyltransferase [Chloroflexi bacterium]|nr:sugar phosphate nucleotidyltransferase [Chloroflexota bacterium]MDA1004126.1 sugar phosphate nucleotidyltransferase [Chloroflexota bacterium]
MILTGGLGTRLRPLTLDLPKALVPILNRPLIAYGIDLLADAGVREIVVVVAGGDDRTGSAAIAAAPAGIGVSVAVQEEPRGSGDAVVCAGAALDGRRVIVLAVDTLLRGSLASHVAAFMSGDDEPGWDVWLVLHHTDRPTEMGIAIVEGDRVVDLEEKPAHPRSNLALCGVWMLAPAAIERLRTDPVINANGEADLTRTVAAMLADGHRIGGRELDGYWLDVGTIPSLLTTQAILLDEADRHEQTDLIIERSDIEEPVLLGAGTLIEDATLGPNVVIGAGCVLRHVRLRDALVAPGATLEHMDEAHVVVTANGVVGRAQRA